MNNFYFHLNSSESGTFRLSSFVAEEADFTNEKRDQFNLNSAKLPSLHKGSLRKKSHSQSKVL